MAEFSAADVAKLRRMTNAGMMECKKALTKAEGDFDKAIDILRIEQGVKADKKGDREANEGLIAQAISADSKAGVLVEINCETDFVAKNPEFQAFCDGIAKTFVENIDADVEEERKAQIAKMGENTLISRKERFAIEGSGLVAAYIHTGGKVGVLVEVAAGKDDTVNHEDFKQLVRDVTLQIAAASPIAVSREQVDPAVIAKEKEIAGEQFKDKPAAAIEKIVSGKMEKFFQTTCLVDQGFVKDPDSTISEYVAKVGKALDDTIEIKRFLRYQVGG